MRVELAHQKLAVDNWRIAQVNRRLPATKRAARRDFADSNVQVNPTAFFVPALRVVHLRIRPRFVQRPQYDRMHQKLTGCRCLSRWLDHYYRIAHFLEARNSDGVPAPVFARLQFLPEGRRLIPAYTLVPATGGNLIEDNSRFALHDNGSWKTLRFLRAAESLSADPGFLIGLAPFWQFPVPITHHACSSGGILEGHLPRTL